MNFRAARQNMVDSQVRPNGITDRRIIDAMGSVAREDFVPGVRRDFAYMDEDIQLTQGANPRWLMEAMTFARMLQMAEIRPEDKILIVGAATGYGAAVTARIGAHVVALEQDEELARAARANLDGLLNVTLAEGEHASGHAAAAPYDVVLIEGTIEVVPQRLADQLADGGRLVAPVRQGHSCALRLGTKKDGVLSWRQGPDCSVPEVPGFRAPVPEFVF